MAAGQAWLLRLEGGHRAAVGTFELVHVLTGDAALFPVPGMPITSRQVLLWGNRPLPVVDLSAWVGGRPASDAGVVAVVAYTGEGGVAQGALLLDAVPRQAWVDDEQALDRPELPSPWAALSHSAYRDEEGPVPVLDLARIFSRVWPVTADAH